MAYERVDIYIHQAGGGDNGDAGCGCLILLVLACVVGCWCSTGCPGCGSKASGGAPPASRPKAADAR